MRAQHVLGIKRPKTSCTDSQFQFLQSWLSPRASRKSGICQWQSRPSHCLLQNFHIHHLLFNRIVNSLKIKVILIFFLQWQTHIGPTQLQHLSQESNFEYFGGFELQCIVLYCNKLHFQKVAQWCIAQQLLQCGDFLAAFRSRPIRERPKAPSRDPSQMF